MPRVVAALLQKAASVAAVDHEGDTALHDAATYADSACLQHLLHASASPSARPELPGRNPVVSGCGHIRQPSGCELAFGAPLARSMA